jgi:hypothetical protein
MEASVTGPLRFAEVASLIGDPEVTAQIEVTVIGMASDIAALGGLENATTSVVVDITGPDEAVLSALSGLDPSVEVNAAFDLSPAVAVGTLQDSLGDSSLVSLRAGLQGSGASVASAIRELQGAAPSAALDLRGSAAEVASAVVPLQGTEALTEVTALLTVTGPSPEVASALTSLEGLTAASAVVRLRGPGKKVVEPMLERDVDSLDLTFTE